MSPKVTMILRWVVPLRRYLCVVARVAFGVIGNIVLVVFVAPNTAHVWNISAYPHLTLNPVWVCAIFATPSAVVLTQLPLFLSARSCHRWAALSLSLYPVLFIMVVWQRIFSKSYN